MKLWKVHLKPVSAAHYWIQAGHRADAINWIADLIRDQAAAECEKATEALELELATLYGNWGVETLVQGAYLREYHTWEKETKAYFNDQRVLNAENALHWKSRPPRSHVERIREQMEAFMATGFDLTPLEYARVKANVAKHEPGLLTEHFLTWEEWQALIAAVREFWAHLEALEDFRLS